MDLQKLAVKIFAEESAAFGLAEFIEIFHRWIQMTDGIYHDVADYRHMAAGPGIVLVAQDAHLSIEETDHRRGLVYSQRGRLGGSNQEKLRHVLKAALVNGRRLANEPSLCGRLKFKTDEVLIWVNDRLIAGNTQTAFQDIQVEVEALAKTLYGDGQFTLSRKLDPRIALNALIHSSSVTDLETLLSRLAIP